MSIFSALNSGVSGLAAQSAKFGAISDNIANSSTVGYKRAAVQFSSLVSGNTVPGSFVAGGVGANVNTEISKQGFVQSSTSATDLAISGRGFFVVSDRAVSVPGNEKDSFFTRAGAFKLDPEGNLRNTAGLYLQGWRLDAQGQVAGGEPSRTSLDRLQTVNLSDITGIATQTRRIDFAANLPAALTGPAAPTQPIATSIDYFTPLGATQRLTLEWLPSATPNQWQLSVVDNSGAAPATIGSVDVEFHDGIAAPPAAYPGAAAGSLIGLTGTVGAPPNGITAIDEATGTLELTIGDQVLELSFGPAGQLGGLTQWGDQYVPTRITKDGAGYAPLDRVEVNDDGVVVAIFRNGFKQDVYRLPVADVTNPDGLKPIDGNAFDLSLESGGFYLWNAGAGTAGTVNGGALEASNVDIAEELTSLIETQRAYTSAARIIQTADELMDTTNQMLR